jgi:hypothetical protein
LGAAHADDRREAGGDAGDDARPIKVVASDDARAFILRHGGRVCVWTQPHRSLRVTITLLETDTNCPDDAMRRFERIAADDIEVYLYTGVYGRPRELVLELSWTLKRVRAYWENHAYVI